MSKSVPHTMRTCSSCGSVISPWRGHCTSCEAFENARVIDRSSTAQFSLATLMLAVLVLAMCLAVIKLQLLLGLMLVAVVVPTMIRTFGWAAYARAQGRQPSTGNKVAVFVGSFVLVAALLMIAGIVAAFIAAMVGILLSFWIALLSVSGEGSLRSVIIVGSLFGGIGGLWLFVYLLRLTWPGEETRQQPKP